MGGSRHVRAPRVPSLRRAAFHMADTSAKSVAASAEHGNLEEFAAVRAMMEDKLHQHYNGTATKDLPPRMKPRNFPKLEDVSKVDWDDWKKWDWMQPGWKGPKQHCVCVIEADNSAEIRSVWK